MRKYFLLLCCSALLTKIGFSQDISKLKGPRPVIDLAKVPSDAYKKGIISIKFNKSVEPLLNEHPALNDNGIITFGIPAVDSLNKTFGVTQAFLSFESVLTTSNSDKHQLSIDPITIRHKAWGLNLWYKLKFPATVDIKEMVAKYQQLTGIIDVAEPNYKVQMINDKTTNSPATIPNDPKFPLQWNYNNTGQTRGTPGADIHLPQAWDIETGDSNVRVAVNDGGIQINHPDIAANMWYNIGYNFVNNTNIIDPSEHGTHTSGTIAAVNNNSIGVSGVAGGDGTPGSGIRLMSMEIFGPDSVDASNFGAPFIWSADRGAAISQNSWSYQAANVFDQEVLDGIDYFIANGGGNVVSGGVVIFSAGNNNSESPKYPAYYPKTIAVAATNDRDIRSYYSDYGDWVDISAPGGEEFSGKDSGGILSTTWHNSYEYLQGTSMACPHVSGVAALIISKAKGLLTADNVRNILLNNVDDIYPLNNPSYAGKLGTGRLNAFKCLQQAALAPDLVDRDAKLEQFILPSKNVSVCTTDFTPVVKIFNLGKDTLKTLQIEVILDGVPLTTYNWNGALVTFGSLNITLAPINTTTGTHTLELFTFNPNGDVDENPSNDTITINFVIQQAIALPASQNFEPASAPMPPPDGWNVINYDDDSTWKKRSDIVGPHGDTTSVMWMHASNYYATGAVDIFSTPKIDLNGIDSINLTFDLSYQQWVKSFVDTLEVVYSPDCGATWLTTGYKKWGPTLSTVGDSALEKAFFPKDSSQWRRDRVSLSTCGISSTGILLGFKWTNGFGNNCFIDNINIDKVNSFLYNASLISIDQPKSVYCTTTFTPQVTLGNLGTIPLTSLNINYQVDDGAVNTFHWTGDLPKCSITFIVLNPVSTTYGDHLLKIYIADPDTQQDQFTANDTLNEQLDISPIVKTPVYEGFETDSLPPTNWSLLNPDGSITWQRSTAAAKTGNASMMIDNHDYTASNTNDQFFSPVIANNTSIDSMFVSFDMAYAPGTTFPGSTALPLDTLEIDVTTDCGITYQTVWKKWGKDLQTVNDPTIAGANAFTPSTALQWKNFNIYLTPYVGSFNYQVFFIAKSNRQNNLWIDNINIYSKTLPKKLKQQGFLIYPNPLGNQLSIYYYQPPTDLKEIAIFNSIGQLIWNAHYNGNANTKIDINMGGNASGVYFIKLTYTDKASILQKVVKN